MSYSSLFGIKEKLHRGGYRMNKEVEEVIVSEKSILTALRLIKTVCEDNCCKTCPFAGKDEDNVIICKIKESSPNNWSIINEDEAWRAFQ